MFSTVPEIYPRPDGSVYICGIGGSEYVSGDRLRAGGDCESAEVIEANPKRVAAARRSFSGLTSMGDKEPDVMQVRPAPVYLHG